MGRRTAPATTGATAEQDRVRLQLHTDTLVLDGVHQPADHDHCAYKAREGEDAEADHLFRVSALRDSKDHRNTESEEQDRGKVRQHQEAFLPLASECASTAAMMFSIPATVRNLVP